MIGFLTLLTVEKPLSWDEMPLEMRAGSRMVVLPGTGSGILFFLVSVRLAQDYSLPWCWLNWRGGKMGHHTTALHTDLINRNVLKISKAFR